MINMTKAILCKLLQRQTYDILSHKYSLILCFLCLVAIIISAFRFGEVAIQWSKDKHAQYFSIYTDNVLGTSYQSNLCQYLPIDIVYTWVNGSDPKLLQDLAKIKAEMEEEMNIHKVEFSSQTPTCTFSYCIESHMVILRPVLAPFVTMDDLVQSNYVFTHARRTFPAKMVSTRKDNNMKRLSGTVVEFDTKESALVIRRQGTLMVRGQNYTILPAFLTTDWTAPHSVLLDDVIIITGMPANEEQLLRKFPENIQQHVTKVFMYEEKSVAVLLVPNKEAFTKILQMDGNLTINNKEPNLHAANLLLHISEEENDDISASRFQDNDELRYSLRSVEKFAPWIRHIFIVTNGQIPSWLDLENPRVTVVSHDELYPNKSHLPTFSSPSIETHLHRIPGLSKKFLYLNDDVIFGKQIWPEDFYTHSKGHKVYLSWSVPDCRDGCPSSWIKDGYCDKPCNNSECQWDGGDCKEGAVGMSFNTHQNLQIWKEESEKLYCSANCANTWLADRYCDQACNVLACAFDAGDCGTADFSQIYKLDLDDKVRSYVLPPGVHLAYFDLTAFLPDPGDTLADGSYEDDSAVRVVAVNQKFKVLTLVLHANHSSTLVISVKGIKNNIEYQYFFNVTVNTIQSRKNIASTIVKKVSTGSLKNEDKLIETSEELYTIPMVSTTTMSTTTVVTFEEFAENKRYPQVQVQSEENGLFFSLVNESAVNFPGNISVKLKELEEELKNGYLTEKGYHLKKSKIIGDYIDMQLRLNQTTPTLHFISTTEKTVGQTDGSSNSSSNAVPVKLRVLKSLRAEDGKDDDGTFMGIGNVEGFENERGFPWEKQMVFNFWQLKNDEFEKSGRPGGRRLLDTFGDSLRHVNRLLNDKFGFEARKAMAHMAHLVDVDVINQLQDRFVKEFDITSANKIRSTTDMQFAFSFFYFIMSEPKKFNIEDVFDSFDMDYSGTWSDKEMRTILTRLYDLPLTYDVVTNFENVIMNCSLEQKREGEMNPTVSTPPFERYLDSQLPTVSKNLVRNCEPIVNLLRTKLKVEKKYKYEIVGEEEVAFKMIKTNSSQVIAQLDDLRKKPRKFICLNDNIEHRKPEAATVKALLIDFYESFFPIPSQFELPREYRNRFLYVTELKEWRKQRDFLCAITYTCLGVLVFLSVASFYYSEIFRFLRRFLPRRRMIFCSKKKLQNV